jgi:hypothetical protein
MALLTSTYLIDIAQDRLLNAIMFDDLPQNASITTTNYQDLLGIWVGVHCQMSNHLLVCELVPLGALDDIVQNQDGAVVGGFEDEHVLVLALLVVEDILDLEGHCLAGPHVGDLAEPAIWRKACLLASIAVVKHNLGQNLEV